MVDLLSDRYCISDCICIGRWALQGFPSLLFDLSMGTTLVLAAWILLPKGTTGSCLLLSLNLLGWYYWII